MVFYHSLHVCFEAYPVSHTAQSCFGVSGNVQDTLHVSQELYLASGRSCQGNCQNVSVGMISNTSPPTVSTYTVTRICICPKTLCHVFRPLHHAWPGLTHRRCLRSHPLDIQREWKLYIDKVGSGTVEFGHAFGTPQHQNVVYGKSYIYIC